MAGFATSPGFRVSPPRVNPQPGSSFLDLGVPSASSRAGFLDNPNVATSQINNSPEHQANVYLARLGLNNTYPSGQRDVSGDNYGFSPEDYNHIMQFTANPMGDANIANYNSIVQRILNSMMNNSAYSGWNQDQRQRAATDLPIHLGQQFSFLPSQLNNWHLGFPSI
jgi:hypothetical protein